MKQLRARGWVVVGLVGPGALLIGCGSDAETGGPAGQGGTTGTGGRVAPKVVDAGTHDAAAELVAAWTPAHREQRLGWNRRLRNAAVPGMQ